MSNALETARMEIPDTAGSERKHVVPSAHPSMVTPEQVEELALRGVEQSLSWLRSYVHDEAGKCFTAQGVLEGLDRSTAAAKRRGLDVDPLLQQAKADALREEAARLAPERAMAAVRESFKAWGTRQAERSVYPWEAVTKARQEFDYLQLPEDHPARLELQGMLSAAEQAHAKANDDVVSRTAGSRRFRGI